MKRRDLIRSGVLAGLAGATGLGGLASRANGASARRRPRGGEVRNIIFFAYDGFNLEDLSLARYFAARQGMERLALEALMGDGAAGSMLSHSLTSVVTDSSAASSAWSVGRKIVNGAVSMYPDGRALTTILELARDVGRATGIITTTRVTHATPAGWIAKVPSRGMENEIAAQYLDFAPDLILGGGRDQFTASLRADGRDLLAEFGAAGYELLSSPGDLAAARGPRTLGLFADDHIPYEIDRRFQGVETPSLADMTREGLRLLDRHAPGFVVQIEAGRIDHANHGNDAGACLWDILAADRALAAAREFVDRTPDTLLLVASDHATGGLAVYGFGSGYNDSTAALETIGRRRASFDHLVLKIMERDPSVRGVRAAVREYYGIEMGEAEAVEAARTLAGDLRLGHPSAHGSYPNHSFHQLVSRMQPGAPSRPNVNYATGAHTAGLVPVVAYGAWDGAPNPGVVDNTDLFGWMTRALGVDFRNPSMTEAEALRLGAAGPVEEMVVM